MSYKKRKIMIVVAVAFGFCVIGLWAWHESRPTYRVPSLDTPLHMRLAQGALRFVGLGPSRRSFVSRTHSDMRSLEAALGSYRMDTGKYPAERPFAEIVPAPEFLAEHNADKLSTIQSGGMGVEGLTTPIPYMDRIPADIFMDPLPYGYFYYPATKINSAG